MQQIDGHGPTDDPDYFVNIGINDVWFTNEGSQETVPGAYDPIAPHWAFARNAGLTGTASVKIELWDDDDGGEFDPDDHSDVYTDPDSEERSLWLTVDLATGAISGDLTGNCNAQLVSEGDDTPDRSRIWFRIILPNQPPVVDAGPDQTVHESDPVTLGGSFNDPNADDTHTVLWHLESSTNGQAVPNSTSQSLSFTPIDDGVYTFSFTVTDNHGAQGSNTVVVTAENVAPVAAIDSVAPTRRAPGSARRRPRRAGRSCGRPGGKLHRRRRRGHAHRGHRLGRRNSGSGLRLLFGLRRRGHGGPERDTRVWRPGHLHDHAGA